MYYNHQQDTQDADKLILPALGGDRGVGNFKTTTGVGNSKDTKLYIMEPLSRLP